jgi:hypothetical protein
MTAATITTIPALIEKTEISASTKLTEKQAELIRNSDGPDIIAGPYYRATANTTQASIDELTDWVNTPSWTKATDKATVKRVIANMKQELEWAFNKANFDRNLQIDQLVLAAKWTDEMLPGTSIELSNDDLRIKLINLNSTQNDWYYLDSVRITAEIALTEDGTPYTRYYDQQDYRKEWSVAGTLELAIEQAKTRLMARHATNTAEAYQRKINAEATLTAAGIGW